ncbi:hypothetical protein GCM10022262_39630 [Georgenia daeguensis]|uniref:Major facilitator superfamily (MFS) profile domain-containing protein n=2 Tax=Georgenia daeguensis TaxID=908355 RepID=A0ABP6UP19_9MICO
MKVAFWYHPAESPRNTSSRRRRKAGNRPKWDALDVLGDRLAGMEGTRTSPETVVAVATLALAGAAAIVLGVGDTIGFMSDSAETLFIAAQIVGWTLLAWATILGGLGAVQLLRRLVSRNRPALPAVLLLVVGAAVIVAVASTHLLWGSGSGSA